MRSPGKRLPPGLTARRGSAPASVVSILRKSTTGEPVLIVCHLTPGTRSEYGVGVPSGGYWRELLNSDAGIYGGSNQGNQGGVDAQALQMHGRPYSLNLTLPGLSALFFKAPPGS